MSITGSCYGKLKCSLINTSLSAVTKLRWGLAASKSGYPSSKRKKKTGLREISSSHDCLPFKWGNVPVVSVHGSKVVLEMLHIARKVATSVSARNTVLVEPPLWVTNTRFLHSICKGFTRQVESLYTSNSSYHVFYHPHSDLHLQLIHKHERNL